MPEHRAKPPFIGPTPVHTVSPDAMGIPAQIARPASVMTPAQAMTPADIAMASDLADPLRSSLRRRLLTHLLVPGVLLTAFGARKACALEINVNAASVEDLRSLQGLGPQLAQRIVRERARGPYRDLEDLRARVRGLGERTVRTLVRHGLRVRPVSSVPRLSDNPASSGTSPPVLVRP